MKCHQTITVILLCLGMFCVIGSTYSTVEKPTAKISLGSLEGHYKFSYGGHKFAAFEGIPYAKPPVGDLRFEPPQEPEPWTGVWKANKLHTCLQIEWMSEKGLLTGTEDCLYLNVYVPECANNFDTIVFIHGGCFMMGKPKAGGPVYLLDKDIVYVSINYRLGPFGFLSTDDIVVPGNMGLKDQSMALSWIQRHIKNLGGNPNSVTIIGTSAGAGSVHLHYFSSLSKGLFHKGISQGGTALSPWAVHKSPLNTAKRLSASIGCDNPSTAQLVACLKNKTASDVVKNAYSLSDLKAFPVVPFGPVIEKKNSRAFLSDWPYRLLNAGQIANAPWITGAVTEEGILGLVGLYFDLDYINANWDRILDLVLNYEHVIAEIDKRAVAQSIKKFYLNGQAVTEDNIQEFVKLFSDRYFYLGMEKATRLHAKKIRSPVYAYMYGYKQDSQSLETYDTTTKYGVSHGSDTHLLLGESSSNIKLSEGDLRIKEMLVSLVTSFAKNGKPIADGVNWDPVTHSNDFKYLYITNNGTKLTTKPELASARFWESLPLREPPNVILHKDEL